MKESLAELGTTRQYLGKDLDLYVRRFHKRALDCCEVNEEVFVNVFLHVVLEEYCIVLKNLVFLSFSRLAAKRTNESVRRTSKSSAVNHSILIARPMPRKRPIVATF